LGEVSFLGELLEESPFELVVELGGGCEGSGNGVGRAAVPSRFGRDDEVEEFVFLGERR
jgi:hypothetical protein